MPKSLPDDLGKILADHERRLNALSSGNRLDHASLDGTTLYIKDEDGSLRGRLGRQPDGSFGNVTVRVEPPPQLTAPILTVGQQAGTCLVEWDGGTFDGRRMPLIHGHTEVWAELVGEDWDPTVAPGEPAKRVGTIRDRTGGEVVVALPQAGTWAVWLRAMGADRETTGPWSPVSTVEITPLVDTEAIEQELEEARDRLEQAEQDLAAGMADRKAEIDYLREERIPALQDALVTGLDDVYREAQQYAEAQASDAVNQAAANAQSEYDRLQELAERALSRAGDNVLEDPSFETDYWINNLNLVDRDAWLVPEARTGDYALAIGGGSNRNLNFATVDVEPGDSWRFSVWYRSPEGDEPNISTTRLRLRDGATNSELESSTNFIVEGDYTRAVVTVTIPEQGVTSLNAALYVNHDQGTLIIDDIALQEVGAAAEALRMAEVARQQAEAAHIAAGNAVDTAANAYDAASSKSTVHWSLSAPSGTADSTDDVWWQYELRNGKRVVIGQWFWDDGVWRETEIAEEWLPRVNIGTGTYGDLSGDRLEANTVKAGALAIMPDSQDFAPDLVNHADVWETLSDVTLATSNAAENGMAWRITGSGNSNTGRARGPWIPAKAGDTIRYRLNVGHYTRVPDGELRVYFMYNGSVTSWTRVDRVTSTGTVEGIFTVSREGTESVAFGVNIDTPATNGGDWSVRDFDVRKQVKGVLIEPEGIKSPQVDTEEFFAAQAVIEKIWADIVRSRLIQSEGIITEDMIATGAITTPKLTVTEELVGELSRFLKIEAGSLASNDIEAMRIVSSLIESSTYLIHNADGDVSVRLDGMNNFIAGELNTFATPAERDTQLGPNVTLGTSASTINPPIDWRREQDGWVPTPGAWKLDEIDFSNQPTDEPQRLHIHPDLQGMFSRYEVVVRAGVVEGSGLRALMVIVNDEYGSGYERYRWASRAERADGTVDAHSSEDAGTHPRVGYVGRYEGHLQVNLTTPGYGPRGYLTWETNGWANAGAGGGGWLVKSGGRWSAPDQVRVPITHFGVRPATGAGRHWAESASAELWGYR